MSRAGVIQAWDRQPLGTAKEVRDRLQAAFPGSRFVLESADTTPSGWVPWWRTRDPSWCGFFQSNDFAVEFDLGDKPIVKAVRLTVHGRFPAGAGPYFARLSDDTGWQVTF